LSNKLTPSDRSFARGLHALETGNSLEALAFFESSLKLDESAPNVARRARITSYYGYCLAAALGRTREGLTICGWVAMWRPLEIFLYSWRVTCLFPKPESTKNLKLTVLGRKLKMDYP